ncbi:MAG: HAD-IB family hydrolase, partial [Acidimicrobiia bacterium]|nr:HAD-IB family hydrolase [Acidimicrobiia bacterium]
RGGGGGWGGPMRAANPGAPVIPIGLWGTEKVWPRNARLPNVLNVTSPPDVTVRVGPPVELAHEDPEADTEAVMAAIVDLLPPEAREVREPTAEELASVLPPGASADAADAEREANRRPGTD